MHQQRQHTGGRHEKGLGKDRRINKARADRKMAAEQAKPEWERKWEARELARAHGYIPYLSDEVAAYRDL
jgi:hypothetical protein